jgi:hypothetical protein
MILSGKHKAAVGVLGALACVVAVVGGCGESDCRKAICNLPPETFVSYGPAEHGCSRFAVQVYWTGKDPDGRIEAFEVATLRGITEDTVEDLDYDDLCWGSTTSRESTFVVDTDSCCVSEDAPPDSLVHWAVFVRAVDNHGARDPEPGSIFFQTCNVIPRVKIIYPEVSPIIPWPLCLPACFRLEWEGDDPDGNDAGLEYKYIALPEDMLDPGAIWPDLPPLDYEGSGGGNACPPVGMWSEWVPSDCTYVCDLDLTPYAWPLYKSVFIMVTARDEGGALLAEHLWSVYNNDENWIKFAVCGPGAGVTLIIDGGILGIRASFRRGEYMTGISSVFAPAEVRFKFYGEESRARGEIAEAYRYYYDSPMDPSTSACDYWTRIEAIREEGRSPEWIVSFPEDGSARPQLGRHVFVAEIKDGCGIVSHCELHFEVLESERVPRGVYLVDDDRAYWLDPGWDGYEDEQDPFWEDILSGYEWDRFDTGRNYDEEVPVRFIANSSTVIWVVDGDFEHPSTQLLDLCSGRLGNYLHSYVKVGGNLIVMGLDPVCACGYWYDGSPNPDRRATYTSWDFRPCWRSAEQETAYHWMWDVFGIEKISVAMPPFPFTALWPCDGCHEAFADTIELGPQASRIDGRFGNAAYITQLRDDVNVVPLYGTARLGDSEWIDSGSHRLVAVYVPSDGVRGHAAYIGVPEYWFDHAKMKTMIRRILHLFGEHGS